MSSSLVQPNQQPSALSSSQSKTQIGNQNQQKINYDGQNPPEQTGQKKQEDNDYQCEFKLVVKQKFKEKLKHDETDCIFTVIINEIIEERIRKNYVQEEQNNFSQPELITNSQQIQQLNEQKKSVPSQLDKLKAEDELVKKRIKELLRKKSKKKTYNYELDPNRDKGFILAKRMNEIKQEREKKYLQTRRELSAQKDQLIQSQMSTIACIENFSMHLARKGNRRHRKESEDNQKLPRIPQNNNYLNETDKFNKSRNGFHDFLNKNNRNAEQIPQKLYLSTQKYQSLTLSARSTHNSKTKDKKRDLLREIEILKKSQKITEKYQTRKLACDILYEVIFNAVKLVQKKKEFYFNAPPKPVHEMIRNYKDKNGKTVWIPGSKPDKFRINVHLKQTKKENSCENNNQQCETIEQCDQKDIKNLTRISQAGQTIDVCINSSRTEKSQESMEENESQKRSNEDNQDNDESDQEEKQESQKANPDKDIDDLESDENKADKSHEEHNEQNPEIAIYL